jgi:hypothetical protein
MRSIFALLAAAVVTAAAPASAGGNPETAEIPESGGLKLKAVLFRPDGSGPFPPSSACTIAPASTTVRA